MAATPSTASAERRPALTFRLPRVGTWPALEILGIVAVTGLALVLRLHGLTDAPLFTDDLDEMQFAWAGLNLIQHGDPITWSYYPGYPSYEAFTAFGVTVPLVHHWMDHPPLYSLLIGGWVWLLGARDMTGFDAAEVRLVPVACSTLTVPLTYLLGRRFIGAGAAMVGALLLATAPAAVLLGRVAEPESAQAVLLLLALLLTLRVLDGRAGAITVLVLLVCAVAAPLLKVSGIAIAGICAVILAASGRWKLAGILAGGGALGIVLFAVYGAFVDWGQFVRTWGVQASNRISVMSAFDFITAPSGLNRRLRDGWWLLGWIGLGLLAARRLGRRELFLIWPAAAYTVTMLVLAGEKEVEQYGWYRVIVYPELYLAAGWLAWEAVRRRSLPLLTILLALGGATATNWWLGGADSAWVPNPLLLCVLIGAVLLPAVLVLWRPDDRRTWRIAGWTSGAAVAVMALGGTIESLQLDRFFFRM
ncbi:MAG TPA: glycosyltransferase family 39 protein [Terriglobales bacterium]|nr:glycosyltransferase family 39 protein [Terriglobales bacterium]